MKVLLVLAAVIGAISLGACRSGQPLESVGTKYYELHEDVFGCPPVEGDCYKKPEKSLDAVGPKSCDPVYKKPAWCEKGCKLSE